METVHVYLKVACVNVQIAKVCCITLTLGFSMVKQGPGFLRVLYISLLSEEHHHDIWCIGDINHTGKAHVNVSIQLSSFPVRLFQLLLLQVELLSNYVRVCVVWFVWSGVINPF